MLPFADHFYENADVPFQQHLASPQTAKGTQIWLGDHGGPLSD